jgi:hypothetical protein
MYRTVCRSLGWQYRSALLTYRVSGVLSDKTNVSFSTAFTNSPEYSNILSDWLYYKLKSINIIFEPTNTHIDSRPLYLNVVFGKPSYDVPNIETDDQTKIVPGYRTRFMNYNYRVPKLFSSENDYPFQMYTNLDKVPVGSICLFSPSNTSVWRIRIEFNVTLKGSKTEADNRKGHLYLIGKKVVTEEEIVKHEEEMNLSKQLIELINVLKNKVTTVSHPINEEKEEKEKEKNNENEEEELIEEINLGKIRRCYSLDDVLEQT